MIHVAAEEAYRLWAPTYADETAVSLLENDLALALAPPLTGKRLLDAGCGTGRRLMAVEAALAVGVDLCQEMIFAGDARRVAVADVRALPFPGESFDMVWCRLMIGHLRDPTPAYRELARVCASGGSLFVSDFHPDAVAAGHSRSFRDQAGTLYTVEHHAQHTRSHIEMAKEAGFALKTQQDARIGDSVQSFYIRAGREAAYRKDSGLAVVAAFLFERTADAPAH